MTGQRDLRKTEEAKLEAEYRECCQDWRWRDKYVLDKLPAAGILFGLLGVALGMIPAGGHIIKILLVLIGGLFSIVLSISVAKDTWYRDGTEKLLRRLSTKLGISSSLQTLKSLDASGYVLDDGLNSQELQFPRKIKIDPDKSSLALPKWLRNWLLKQPTFRWILAFYLGSLLIFAVLFILIVVDCIWELSLPF